MQDLTGKITGSTLTAAEWNQLPQEVQNVITALGITLGSGDLNQLGKAIAGYVAGGSYYVDSGAVNTLVLSPVGSKQSPASYFDGMRVDVKPANTNTGAATVNVNGLGVKNITDTGVGGELEADVDTALRYNNGTGEFEIIPRGISTPPVFTESFTSSPQTITSGGSLTIAHGLSTIPTVVYAYLTCLTAEYGYSIGDVLIVSTAKLSTSAFDNVGMSVVPDSTNLNIRFGSFAQVFPGLNKTTGTGVDLTNTNWELTFEAVA